jgi:hypothetical protein
MISARIVWLLPPAADIIAAWKGMQPKFVRQDYKVSIPPFGVCVKSLQANCGGEQKKA